MPQKTLVPEEPSESTEYLYKGCLGDLKVVSNDPK